MNWYYYQNESIIGPISETALHELKTAGVISEETLVRSEESEDWTPFNSITPENISNDRGKTSASLATQPVSKRRNPNYWIAATVVILLAVAGSLVAMKMIGGVKRAPSVSSREEYQTTSQKQTDPTELFKLGLRYFEGEKFQGEAALNDEVEVKDIEKAFNYFLSASELGNADAQYYLAVCYASDFGPTKNLDLAMRWLKESANQGLPKAQFMLGVGFINGEGVDKDEETGLSWIKKASDHRHPDAQYYLGRCHLLGEGLPTDEAEGIRLLRLAAEQGYAAAYYDLGLCYDEGIGVERNPLEAVRLYGKASRLGHKKAKEEYKSHPYNPNRNTIETTKAELSKQEVQEVAAKAGGAGEERLGVTAPPSREMRDNEEKIPDQAPVASDRKKDPLTALGAFKNATLDEAKECIRLLDEELAKDPKNARIPVLKTTIMNVFRAEASLVSALNTRAATGKEIERLTQNLAISSKPSSLTGKVNNDEVQRIRRELDAVKSNSASKIQAAKSALQDSLDRARKTIPSPDKEALSGVWEKISDRNGL